MNRIMFLFFFLIVLASGCVSNKDPQKKPEKHITDPPPNLTTFNKGLTVLALAGVVGVGVGVALFFVLPQHRLSMLVGGISAGTLATALVLKVTLWLLPWVAGAGILLGLVLFGIELSRELRTGRSWFDRFQSKRVSKGTI